MGVNSFMMGFPQFFGRGCAAEAGEKLANFNCKRAFVIYGKGIEALGIPIPIIKAIEASEIAVITCNKVESDPSQATCSLKKWRKSVDVKKLMGLSRSAVEVVWMPQSASNCF